MITDFHGLRVTVMGLGTFGGGIGAVRFLVARGAIVTVTDLRSEHALRHSIGELESTPPARWRLGGHHADDFTGADLIVVSPAVPRENDWLNLARQASVTLTSEMNLFWERNRGRVIAITGSNGKSTTTAMIHALMSRAVVKGPRSPITIDSFPTHPQSVGEGGPCDSEGTRVWLGGNIGQSLLPVVDEIQPRDWVVLELSSFQLEDLASLQPNPECAVVTNFTPNHLDRHGTVEAYRQAKQNLLRWQRSDRIAVLNQDDPDVARWETAARVVGFGTRDVGTEGLYLLPGKVRAETQAIFRFANQESLLPIGRWLTLPGDHNLKNALAAGASALALGADNGTVESGLSAFRGLPHRLELVADCAGRRFYNDSKATTPEAAILALRAFAEPVVLMAGGYDKEIDLLPLVRAMVDRPVRAVALLGQTAVTLEAMLQTVDPAGGVLRQSFHDFESAFRWAAGQSQAGDVVLLSPGCASYDWFENYEERGRVFQDLAGRLETNWTP
ncbi:MAG: UDP-N-acetylmuramoyl-L-alanine--D-glutamate ligase [Planctomycetota bacterium]|nr:UDP-N-acetylmuramoyl-L-alanine--D-glutamate ligase [Planctomycetota bacterium]